MSQWHTHIWDDEYAHTHAAMQSLTRTGKYTRRVLAKQNRSRHCNVFASAGRQTSALTDRNPTMTQVISSYCQNKIKYSYLGSNFSVDAMVFGRILS